jgi:hypothetical protein
MEDLVQVKLVKYLHCAEVVFQHSEWKDTIPPSGYQNFEEKNQNTLRNIFSFVKISGKENRSLMKIPNSCS